MNSPVMPQPPSEEEESLRRAILEAVRKSDSGMLERCTVLAPVLSYTVVSESGQDTFSDRIFDLILQLLEQEEYLQMQGSSYLVHMLELEWDMLSQEQKDTLLPGLETAYGRFRDWLSSFLITEILGECYANQKALDCVCRLESQKDLQHRALLPHAFEHLVRDSKDQDVKKKALERLRAMKNDPSENVVAEATLSLGRLGLADS
jgi:hypothetical protein